jgi:hypothetical protein
MILVEGSFVEWREDPDYLGAYDALEDEFSITAAMIKTRTHASLTACAQRKP